MPGNGCKPITEANGENGIHMPISMIAAVNTIKGSAARLCTNGILPVRLM